MNNYYITQKYKFGKMYEEDIIEYTTLSTLSRPIIGLTIMVKNEAKTIALTIKSAVDYVGAIIVYDTGSTDDTIKVIKRLCKRYKKNLYLIKGKFVDFSVSRNILLDYSNNIDVDYLLLVDAADQLKKGDELVKFAKKYWAENYEVFFVNQYWWSGRVDNYYNTRFIKNGCTWRYTGPVHEHLSPSDGIIPDNIIKIPKVVLYQDRTNSNTDSSKRFARDKKLLLQEYEKDKNNPRTLFYLAQTCECLKDYSDALYYAKKHLNTDDNFDEQIFHSLLRCGVVSSHLGHDWEHVLPWYMKAYEHSNRAEPLINIATYYYQKKKWHSAFMFVSQACSLIIPKDAILFVDTNIYNYERWHLLGVISYYIGKYDIGEKACIQAIQNGGGKEIDKHNLEFYLSRKKSHYVNQT